MQVERRRRVPVALSFRIREPAIDGARCEDADEVERRRAASSTSIDDCVRARQRDVAHVRRARRDRRSGSSRCGSSASSGSAARRPASAARAASQSRARSPDSDIACSAWRAPRIRRTRSVALRHAARAGAPCRGSCRTKSASSRARTHARVALAWRPSAPSIAPPRRVASNRRSMFMLRRRTRRRRANTHAGDAWPDADDLRRLALAAVRRAEHLTACPRCRRASRLRQKLARDAAVVRILHHVLELAVLDQRGRARSRTGTCCANRRSTTSSWSPCTRRARCPRSARRTSRRPARG